MGFLVNISSFNINLFSLLTYYRLQTDISNFCRPFFLKTQSLVNKRISTSFGPHAAILFPKSLPFLFYIPCTTGRSEGPSLARTRLGPTGRLFCLLTPLPFLFPNLWAADHPGGPSIARVSSGPTGGYFVELDKSGIPSVVFRHLCPRSYLHQLM